MEQDAKKDLEITGPLRARRCARCRHKRMVMRITVHTQSWRVTSIALCPGCLVTIALVGMAGERPRKKKGEKIHGRV